MAKAAQQSIDEKQLTKGQVRKLNALRKSVGEEIGNKAFAAWLTSQPADNGAKPDANAELIANTLWSQIQSGKLAIPRGGYLVRRGRGRVIVEAARGD